MVVCADCGMEIGMFDPVLFDVFNSDEVEAAKQYCVACFANTVTAQIIASTPPDVPQGD